MGKLDDVAPLMTDPPPHYDLRAILTHLAWLQTIFVMFIAFVTRMHILSIVVQIVNMGKWCF